MLLYFVLLLVQGNSIFQQIVATPGVVLVDSSVKSAGKFNETARDRTGLLEFGGQTYNYLNGRRVVWQKEIERNVFSSASNVILLRKDASLLNSGVLLNSSSVLIRGAFDQQSLVYSLAYEFVFNGPIRPLRHISSSDPKNGDVYTIIHFSEKFLPPAIPAKRLKTGRLREDVVCQIFGFSDSFDLHRLRSSVCAKQFCGELFPRVENTFCVELEILNKTKAEDGLRFLYLPLARGMKKYRIEGGAIPFKVEDNYPVFCKNSGEYLFAGFPIYQKMWKRRPYMLVQRMFI